MESVRLKPGQDRYLVRTADEIIEALNVVVATGAFQQPRIPPQSVQLPDAVLQLHSRDYRNPAQLPPGAVLVVGSGASGLQICEDLHRSGRTVYLAIGRCNRWPRRYRGLDIFVWLRTMGLMDRVGLHSYIGPRFGCTGVLTGVGGGHDLDYDRLAAEGVTLLGHLRGGADGSLVFADDLRESLALWDESWDLFRDMIEAHIQEAGLEVPPEDGPSRAVDPARRDQTPILELDLAASGISAVIWATGFVSDYGWLAVPVLDDGGNPIQQRGVTGSAGLYFLGLRRMHTLKSGFLFGVGEDAAYLADHIATRARS